MSIKISKEAYKIIQKQPKQMSERIMKNIVSPPPSSVHAYVGQYPDMFVIRTKEYRIICRKCDDDVIVESCGVRGDVYKRTRHKLGRHKSA